MNPELKFHSIIISITTLIIFYLWTRLTAIVNDFPILSVIAAGLVTLGLYRTLVVIALAAFRNVQQIKKFVLGPFYMEGTWVGFFIGHEKQIRFVIESLEQSFNELVVKGKVFKEDNTYHGSYVSEGAFINIRDSKLSYTYNVDGIKNTFINYGLAKFDFDRDAKHLPPNKMTGFSSDLFNPTKLLSFEEKISDKTSITIENALSKAKEVYEKYKSNIE